MNSGTFQDARSGRYIQGQAAGCPDLMVGYKNTRLAWIEVKTGSSLSVEQMRTLRGIHKRGQAWLIARTLDAVIKWCSDESYHGEERDVASILVTSEVFIPAQTHTKGKKTRMGLSTLTEYDRFKSKPQDIPISEPPF